MTQDYLLPDSVGVNNLLNSLNGSVQRQGIKLDVRDWLDIGSETWSKADDKEKAAAYQAALVVGWIDDGLINLMVKAWGPRVDEHTAKMTIEILQEFAKMYPVETQEVYKDEVVAPVFKIKGCDRTIPFPS